MARRTSLGTPATLALTRAGVAFEVRAYEHTAGTTSYGEEAARALGVAPERVFKTLLSEVDGALVVAVVPVSGMLDLKALAAAMGGKRAAMAAVGDAERSTGYVVGGISPFGQRRALPTVLDGSARSHETIYVSAGRRGIDLEVSPDDLVAVLDARVADVARTGGAQAGGAQAGAPGPSGPTG